MLSLHIEVSYSTRDLEAPGITLLPENGIEREDQNPISPTNNDPAMRERLNPLR